MREDVLYRIQATNKPFKIFTDYVEDDAMIQFAECMEQPSVTRGAVMPDAHAGYVLNIGGVIETKDTIFPSFVGYDIGCGVSECMLDIKADDVTKEQFQVIKDEILKAIPIGFERNKGISKKIPLGYAKIINMPMTQFAQEVLQKQGLSQLGTLGGGNHFLEIGKSEETGNLSIVIHSGSRGVGHKIATHYMKEAAIANTDEQRYKREFDNNPKSKAWMKSIEAKSPGPRIATKEMSKELRKYYEVRDEFVYRRVRARVDNIEGAYPLDIHSQIGKDYINDMNMTLEYALENRKVMIEKCYYAICNVIKKIPKELRFINRNHNHAVQRSEDSNYWIHRKGATHAEDGMLGVIPGNMKDGSFIVQGLGNEDSLCSSSHGAGRVLSRRQAKDNLSLDEFINDTKHLVSNHSDSNIDEAPKAYKDIFEVMDNQKDLVKIIDRIIPILNIKG